MAYVSDGSIVSKKALKAAVAAGKKLFVFSLGLGGPYEGRTRVGIEGPHYPKPHRFYATVDVALDGSVSKVYA
jgi:hypothetical protein